MDDKAREIDATAESAGAPIQDKRGPGRPRKLPPDLPDEATPVDHDADDLRSLTNEIFGTVSAAPADMARAAGIAGFDLSAKERDLMDRVSGIWARKRLGSIVESPYAADILMIGVLALVYAPRVIRWKFGGDADAKRASGMQGDGEIHAGVVSGPLKPSTPYRRPAE